MTTETAERDWMEVGAEYTGADVISWPRISWPGEARTKTDRDRVEEQIEALDWREAEDGLSVPFSPGHALNAAIDELRLPKVTKIAWNGYLEWPDGPETAAYSIYGIECNYADARVRVYLLDTGTACIPLAADKFAQQ